MSSSARPVNTWTLTRLLESRLCSDCFCFQIPCKCYFSRPIAPLPLPSSNSLHSLDSQTSAIVRAGGMRRILTNNIFLQVPCNPSGPGPGWTSGAGGQSILTPLLSSSSYNLELLELSVGYLPSCSGDPAGLQSLIK